MPWSHTWNSFVSLGGYGLLGVIATVTIHLVLRQKIRRVVEVPPLNGLIDAFNQLIASGFLYGDFEFAIDPASNDS